MLLLAIAALWAALNLLALTICRAARQGDRQRPPPAPRPSFEPPLIAPSIPARARSPRPALEPQPAGRLEPD